MKTRKNRGVIPIHEKLSDALLYGILDLGYVEQRRMEEVTRELIEGGVGLIQLRAKGYDAGSLLNLIEDHAPNIVRICQSHDVPLIINDFPEVAVALGADGVHIGQDDGSLDAVRKEVGDSMVIGRSTHSLEQAREALREGFDYIGFGPLFPTPTKEGRPGIGTGGIAEVESEIGAKIPVFCIGGIKPENIKLVLASGARRVVIVSALLEADDIQSATCGALKILNTES